MMLLIALAFTHLAYALAAPPDRRDISTDLLNDFVRYADYSSGAYQAICAFPLGNTLVGQFSDSTTDTQGLVARDDTRKEIVVAFRGSEGTQDFLTDFQIALTNYSSPGVINSNSAMVHTGFLSAYNGVAENIILTLQIELLLFPGYSLVSTGHSLGAALASLGGLSLAANFPGVPLRVFTFGQPRTGDPQYAALVEQAVGPANVYRAVHTTGKASQYLHFREAPILIAVLDTVPNLIPQSLGYRHHETEFWNFADPASVDTVRQCSGEEDPTCSDSIVGAGISLAHLEYFGELMGGDSTVCL